MAWLYTSSAEGAVVKISESFSQISAFSHCNGLLRIIPKCSLHRSIFLSFIFDSSTLICFYCDAMIIYIAALHTYGSFVKSMVLTSLFLAASSALDASVSKHCHLSFLLFLLTLSFSTYSAANLSFKHWEAELNILSIVSFLLAISVQIVSLKKTTLLSVSFGILGSLYCSVHS